MNPPKADDLDYIHFLIAAQRVFTCTEAARSQPETFDPPAHDAFTRLLRREPPDTEALWGGTIGQQLDGTVPLLIYDDRPVSSAAQQGEVIHANHLGRRMGSGRGASDVA